MQATIEAPRASVLKYQVVSVILALALAIAIAWAAMASGSTKTVVEGSKPAAKTWKVVPVLANPDFCGPVHERC